MRHLGQHARRPPRSAAWPAMARSLAACASAIDALTKGIRAPLTSDPARVVPNFPAASPDGHETARSPEPGLHEIVQQHCPARRCSRDVRPRPGASNLQQRVDDLLAAHRAAFRREPSYATAVSVGKRQLTVTPICTGLSSATEDRCTHRRTSHARRHRRSRPQRPRSRCLWWPQSSRLPPRGAPRNRFPNC